MIHELIVLLSLRQDKLINQQFQVRLFRGNMGSFLALETGWSSRCMGGYKQGIVVFVGEIMTTSPSRIIRVGIRVSLYVIGLI